jgi:hypothetical protein
MMNAATAGLEDAEAFLRETEPKVWREALRPGSGEPDEALFNALTEKDLQFVLGVESVWAQGKELTPAARSAVDAYNKAWRERVEKAVEALRPSEEDLAQGLDRNGMRNREG